MLIGLYHSAGSVVQYIRQGGAPTVGEKIKILTDIARGLEYLHSRGVVHGQVWGDNVLINDSGGAMLSDAGVRAAVPHVTYDWDRVFWQAPETVEADNDNAPQTSMAADVYALACTAKEIFTSRRPFCGVRNPQLFLVQLSAGQIMDEERFGGIPPAVVNALRGCWDTDPATRPSAATVFRRLDEIQT
ncbi:hypothetical protein PLICRDRAFT_532741 [Plicaturopsis crispa FD-325 SS-3]|nr:hypothetical protein PLICRDRAFT_532741 [Plicaturopsis crispa FD-325 SS-3]